MRYQVKTAGGHAPSAVFMEEFFRTNPSRCVTITSVKEEGDGNFNIRTKKRES